jgi:hypothetical protein
MLNEGNQILNFVWYPVRNVSVRTFVISFYYGSGSAKVRVKLRFRFRNTGYYSIYFLLGFYSVEEIEYTTRLYRIHEAAHGIHLEAVPTEFHSLDSRYVFLLDGGLRRVCPASSLPSVYANLSPSS